MAVSHRTSFDISFKHCDPAGIVFYPRYTEMINDVVEHWFKHGLGCDFATLHGPRGLAVPTAKLEVDFKSPAFLGDTLQAVLSVERLGNSSMRLCVRLQGDGTGSAGALKLVAHLTLVFVDMDNKRPIDIPPDLRSGAERYLCPPAQVA